MPGFTRQWGMAEELGMRILEWLRAVREFTAWAVSPPEKPVKPEGMSEQEWRDEEDWWQANR